MKNIITSVKGPTRNNSIMFVIMDDAPNKKFVNFSNLLDSPGRSYIEFLEYENSNNRSYVEFANIDRSPFVHYIEFVDIYSDFESYSKDKIEYVVIKDKPYLLLSKGAYKDLFGTSDNIDHFDFTKGLKDKINLPENFSRLADFNRNFKDSSDISESIIIAKGKFVINETSYKDVSVILLNKEVVESITGLDYIDNFIFDKSLKDFSNILENISIYSEKSFSDSFAQIENKRINLNKPIIETSYISDLNFLNFNKSLTSEIYEDEIFEISYNKLSQDRFYPQELKYFNTQKEKFDDSFISENSIINVNKNVSDQSILKDDGNLYHYSYTLNNTYFAEKYVGVQTNF